MQVKKIIYPAKIQGKEKIIRSVNHNIKKKKKEKPLVEWCISKLSLL